MSDDFRMAAGGTLDALDTQRLPIGQTLEIGERVGDVYEIRALLGKGGMGSVYEAWDRHLRRRVAVKIATALEAQFSVGKEGRALAAVRHPSMVTVYAFGVHRGIEFLVMELVEGVTLAAHMAERFALERRFAVDEAVELVRRIAEGLSAVHEAGISHRDVKPANIMLAPGNRTVLMDFGLFLPEFARRDQVAGSPEYLAPEVAVQKVAPGGGHLVDLYSLGVIAYELLAGAPPFSGRNAYEILKHHVETPVPPLDGLRPEAPPELIQLVHELLAKEPSGRPECAEFVLWRLRAIAERSARGTPAARRLRVLIVDDDPDVRDSLREAITAGIPDTSVATAGDGETALSVLKRSLPDVLVLDVQLPRMNGLELCMYLRGADPAGRCRVVSVSGTARERDVQVLRDLGVARHLQKGPGLTKELCQALREIVG